MFENRALPFLISAVIFAVAVNADISLERTKRQAPSINVHKIPKTGFSCDNRKIGEYYADPEVHCQVYHVCVPGMNSKMSLISFVCPNGTIFSQATRVCTPYERVDCSLTTKFYDTIHGDSNNKRTNNDNDNDYESNYVPPPPPREQPQPPRQSPRARNTPAPTSPPREAPAQQPPRNTRFRTGTSQFRGQQAPPATTAAPVRATTTVTPVRVVPTRPALPSFRPPALPLRPAQPGGLSNILSPRVTPRPVVSTSTTSYNYEYEYEYDYEDETPGTEQGSTRTKREAIPEEYDQDFNFEENFEKTGFNCQDKVAGGVYADIESNCEMFHICVPMGKYKMLDYKVFCANGTAFDQETGSCREKEEFTCENALLYYQFEKPNQPASSKKPVLKKKKYTKSKKTRNASKE